MLGEGQHLLNMFYASLDQKRNNARMYKQSELFTADLHP